MNDRIFAFMFVVIAFFVLGFTISRAVFKTPEAKKEIVSEQQVEETIPAAAAINETVGQKDDAAAKAESTSPSESSAAKESLLPNKPDAKEEETPKITVTIQNTPTGWLNVREGPAITYKQVKRVNPGETYTLLEEKFGWYKIQLDAKTNGWIASQYAKKQ